MCRFLLVPLLAVTLTGCSLFGQDTPCTPTGGESHVSVVWKPADFGSQDAAKIRLCVNGRCKERTTGSPDDPFMSLSVQLSDDIGASRLPVQLTVSSTKNGETVVKDSVQAKLKKQYPNGKGCPPTIWTATFRAHPSKGLTTPKGMKLQG